MTKIPYMITGNSISVMVNNRMKIIPSSNPNFEALKAELTKPDHDLMKIEEFADLATFIVRKTFGDVQVADDRILYKGTPIHSVLADKMLVMLRNGEDLEPLGLFMNKVMQNPNASAQKELFQWLEAGNAPICPDGDFLAFKRVRDNYTDCHSGTFDNSVGKIVEMDRSKCDTNRNNHCSTGLHFCQHSYLASFGGARTVIVKVNPADVTSIPTDYKFQKGRTWRYEVVGEVDNDEKKTTDHFSNVTVDDRYPSKTNQPSAEQPKVDASKITGQTASDQFSNAAASEVQAESVTIGGNNVVTEKPKAKKTKPASTKKAAAKKTKAPAKKSAVSSSTSGFVLPNGKTVDAKFIMDAIKKSGSIRAAARDLGVSKSTFQGWAKRAGA